MILLWAAIVLQAQGLLIGRELRRYARARGVGLQMVDTVLTAYCAVFTYSVVFMALRLIGIA